MTYSTDYFTGLQPATMTVRAPRMPRLMPMALAPTLPSPASAPLAFLNTVDRIEINETAERDGVTYYALDVFLEHHSSRIPTNRSEQTRLNSSRPDIRVEHRFSDFADLRYRVWSYAQRKHEGNATCCFCDKYMHFIMYSTSQPHLLAKLGAGVGKRKRLFATFCNEFLAMAIGAKMASCSRKLSCDGYRAIPYIIECFLRR